MNPGEIGPNSAAVLVVDDDPDARELTALFVQSGGFRPLEASTGAQALTLTEEHQDSVELVILDIHMPGEDGLSVLGQLHQRYPALPVIMSTSSRDFEHAVAALRNGAYDYLVKPVQKESLLQAVHGALSRGQQSRELMARRALDQDTPVRATDAVFSSTAMRLVISTLERVRETSVPVMLLGESGTGKEVVSRWIHDSSRRAKEPFVAVNCAALPSELLESELFGHQQGAFTGAHRDKRGRFEEAHGGTLFLDEIGELEASAQAKLLRVLNDGRVSRVGGGGEVEVNARVVVATNRDLLEEVEAGRFRADLYYRLEVIAVQLPPLRERLEEIPPLADHLLHRFVDKEGLPQKRLSSSAIEALKEHPWPGNVRELENVLKRSALLSPQALIEAEHLVFGQNREVKPAFDADAWAGKAPVASIPDPPVEPSGDSSGPQGMDRARMLKALAETRGNVSAACRILGVGRSTFYRRAKQYGLPI